MTVARVSAPWIRPAAPPMATSRPPIDRTVPPTNGRVVLRAPTLGQILARTLTRNLALTFTPLLTLAMVGVIGSNATASTSTSTGHTVARSSASSSATYEQQAIAATNTQRSRYKMRGLRADSCLTRFANRQAARMADQRRIYHQDLSPIMGRCNLSGVGENVAYGYPSGTSVVNKGWMESAGHRHNILTRRFRIVAVGAAQDGSGRWYTAQVLGRR